MENIEIHDYTEKSFIVIGDTKSIKDDLKMIGGRFNPNLTLEGERVAGWVFSKNKRLEIEELVSGERDNFVEGFLKVMSQCIFKAVNIKESGDKIVIKGPSEDVDDELAKYKNEIMATGEYNGSKIAILKK